MSGLDIDHGGAISVDPEALRDTATRIDAVAGGFADAHGSIVRAHALIVQTDGFAEAVDARALWTSGESMAQLRDECENAVRGTRLMADVFEYVELQIQVDALALRDEAAADEARLRLEQLAASDPRIPDMASMLVAGWKEHRFDGFSQQGDWFGVLAPLFGAVSTIGSQSGRGTVWPWMRLRGAADPVAVSAVSTSHPRSAPASLHDALSRMPDSRAGAQVAVEKLTMPDGTKKFIAYIAGTQSPLMGGSEPWDMRSNLQLYTGERSASYQATLEALADAGAQPGDEVDVVAHSQAGMIAAYLSHQSGYEVALQVSVGSPVVDMAPDDQTLVRLAHTDDPVYRLSDGGTPAASGSPDSFVATRTDDTVFGPTDPWDPHLMDSYLDLAKEVDASGDPRVEALDRFWDDFGQAVSIERTEYHAERTE